MDKQAFSKITHAFILFLFISSASACQVFQIMPTAPAVVSTKASTPLLSQTGSVNAPAPAPSQLPAQPATSLPATPATIVTSTAQITTEIPSRASVTSVPLQVVVLASDLPSPDDLVLAPDGSIDVSDVSDGKIRQVTPDGQTSILVSGLDTPEGMAWLPDGSLVIAEQGKNRLVIFNPQTQEVTPLIQLKNNTGQLGVDGIAFDSHIPNQPSLIIPDSPNGTLLRFNLDSRTQQLIARGFVRPVAAFVEPDGSLLIVDENAGTLVRIHPDGKRETLVTNLPGPDDVLENSSGNIFVNTLNDGAIHMINADSHKDIVLVSGLSSPQGEIFDADGNLIVTDPGHHQIVRITLPK